MSTRSKPRPRRKPARREGEAKRDATRRTLLESALELFQKRGVEATTMRDIAKAAGLSLGAAYYYFPSKEALVFAYYESNQAAIDERASLDGTLRERLGSVFQTKLETIRPQRAMLASILPHLMNPSDPLSAFSSETRGVRDRAVGLFARALDGVIPAGQVPLVANALWLIQLAAMLLYVHDDSPQQRRTHGLVDDGLDLLVPLLPLLATPPGLAIADRITSALVRAGISPTG